MSRTPPTAEMHRGLGGRFGERFTAIVLGAMALALAYVYFALLPAQERGPTLDFSFVNPMLDAEPGEKVLFYALDYPSRRSCSVVRPEAVVLRPRHGPERLGLQRNLRTALPYLACSMHTAQGGADPCGGAPSGDVVYALNYFGMPSDTEVRVDSIRPRWMKWEDRELVVYEVVFERYGALGGRWTTYLSESAPVAGLVKWTSLLPHQTVVVYREVLD